MFNGSLFGRNTRKEKKEKREKRFNSKLNKNLQKSAEKNLEALLEPAKRLLSQNKTKKPKLSKEISLKTQHDK